MLDRRADRPTPDLEIAGEQSRVATARPAGRPRRFDEDSRA
jgi:hypothetical protein